MKTWWPHARILVALLIFSALVSQLVLTAQIASDADTASGSHLPTMVVNFFSYFTILSNIAAACALLGSAIWSLRHPRAAHQPHRMTKTMVCAASYMIVTGVVYNLLLRGLPLDQGAAVTWANEVLHVVGPVFMLLEMSFGPGAARVGWGSIGTALIFPIMWVGYTLLRAPLITSPATGLPVWYPYPFLNPANFSNGYFGVAGFVIGIAVGLAAAAALCVLLTRARSRRVRSS